MLTAIWTSGDAAEVIFLIAAIVAAVLVVIDLLAARGVNFLAIAVGLIALGLLAL